MKKTLYSTTALAAAGLLTFGASDAFAQAAAPAAPEKLKMTIGGFFTAYAGVASQSDSFERGAATPGANYAPFDIKNDSEISMKGSVTLDNGMKVSLQIEFETDPATAGGNTTNGNTASQVGLDESYLALDTNGFGELRIGNQKQSTGSVNVGSVNVGQLNPGNGDTSLWIIRPSAGMTIGSAFSPVSGADQNRINYISPVVAGFRLATGYTPSTTESDNMPYNGGTSGTETATTDVGLQYSFDLLGFATRTSVAYVNNNGQASASNEQVHFGADVKIGDFTVGGQYSHQWNSGANKGSVTNANSQDLDGFNFGVAYNPGPYRVGFRTTQTWSPGARTLQGEDSAILYKLGAGYTLGPGVELTGDLFHMAWRDEGGGSASTASNQGWALVGGIAVTF
jgi:predicted porin